jgi:hypothetical protein
MRIAVARSDRGSEAPARGTRRAPGPGPERDGARVSGVLEGVDAATDSGVRLDVGGALYGRGVGTRGGAVAPVVITLSY